MAIEFTCPNCHQHVRTPDSAAGKKGKCPHCLAIVLIPAVIVPGNPPTPTPKPAPPPKPAAKPAPKATAASDVIEFACPTCQKSVRTPPSAAGKKGKCPHCQTIVQIPEAGSRWVGGPQSTAKPAAPKTPGKPAPAPGAAWSNPPASDSYGGLTPLPDPGDGLTPLDDPHGGLTPLNDPYGGLTPLPNDPLAGLPVLPQQPVPAASPFGGVPSSIPNPLGVAPGQALNPYAPPSPTSWGADAYIRAAASQVRPREDRHGLPWERDPSAESFWETMNLVLGSPGEAFRQMQREGGVGNPMGFVMVGTVIGNLAMIIYVLIGIGIASAAVGQFDPAEFAMTAVGSLVQNVIGSVSSAAIGTFLTAAVFHVCLLMIGGGHAGYEATYRAICFTWGATYILYLIPFPIGPIISFFYGIAVLIHAFSNTHQISGGKATIAVLLPAAFCLICCLGLALVLGTAIMEAMNELQ